VIKKLTKKLHSKKGMTVGEVLVAVLIMLLATGLLTGGISFATRNLEKSVTESEAHILQSSLREEVNSELRYTTQVSLDDGELCGYFSQNFGKIEVPSGTKVFKSVDKNGSEVDKGYITVAGNHIISKTSYPQGIKASILVSVTTKKEDKYVSFFDVTISIYNRKDELITEETFQVIPLAEIEITNDN